MPIFSDHHQGVSTTDSYTTWYATTTTCLQKNELNREYVITLARNDETPWWWCEKIETCRSGFKCFKWTLYSCICWLIVEVILRNARCKYEIYGGFAFDSYTKIWLREVKFIEVWLYVPDRFILRGLKWVKQTLQRLPITHLHSQTLSSFFLNLKRR